MIAVMRAPEVFWALLVWFKVICGVTEGRTFWVTMVKEANARVVESVIGTGESV